MDNSPLRRLLAALMAGINQPNRLNSPSELGALCMRLRLVLSLKLILQQAIPGHYFREFEEK
jgi:hypothetical protein